MTSLIRIKDMREYRTVVDHVIARGRLRSPRGEPTLDAGQVTVRIQEPSACSLATGLGRGLSPRVAAVEAIQLIGGFHDPDLMVWASPVFARFQDEAGEKFWGAYGERVGDQVTRMVDKLVLDLDTRQAVATLWDPDRDNDPGHRDYPCTVAFGLHKSGQHHLAMNVTMRSNDVWLGFPYDVFQFTQLQMTVAKILGLTPGTYSHTAWSMHIYEKDLPAVENLRYASAATGTFQPQGLGRVPGCGIVPDGGGLRSAVRKASDLVYGFRSSQSLQPRTPEALYGWPLTDSEEWYRGQLEGCYNPARAAVQA